MELFLSYMELHYSYLQLNTVQQIVIAYSQIFPQPSSFLHLSILTKYNTLILILDATQVQVSITVESIEYLFLLKM